jgi:hypothetical protein
VAVWSGQVTEESGSRIPETEHGEAQAGWLQQAFADDLWIKGIALALAAAFWSSVQLSTDVHETVSLRVGFLAAPETMIVGKKMHRVQLNLVGPLAAMEQFRRQQSSDVVHIPAAGFGIGNSSIYLNPDLLGLPKNLRVESIRPAVVRVRLARRITRQVPVKPELVGSPSAGLKVKRWVVVPDQVTVDGPEAAVRALEFVVAGPVSVDRVVKNVVRTVPLRTGALGVQVVDLHEAEVRVEIAAPLLDRHLKGVRVVVKIPGWAARPSSLSLHLKGPLDTLTRLDAADVIAVVTREAIRASGRAGATVLVRLEGIPQGVVRLGPQPTVRLVRSAPSQQEEEGE